jgi:uncharacterized RDD family membrane protein YckC
MPLKIIDNKIYRSLPEGVSVNLTPAGITARAYAYLIDFAIRGIIIIACAFALNAFGKSGQGVLLLLYFISSWGYYIYFEAQNGQTFGKRKLNLRVIQDNGLPPQLSQIILRNLLRPADAFPFGYALGIIVMATNKEFKRIGDWAAGTLVIYQAPLQKKSQNVNQAKNKSKQTFTNNVTHTVKITLPAFSLLTAEQQAILAFAERSHQLSPARQAELANILSPLLQAHDAAASQKLKEIANYYSGQIV